MSLFKGIRKLAASNASFFMASEVPVDPGPETKKPDFPTEKTCTLEFQHGYELQPDPEPRVFKARSRSEARLFAADILDIKLKNGAELNERKFFKAGGASLSYGDERIFPSDAIKTRKTDRRKTKR